MSVVLTEAFGRVRPSTAHSSKRCSSKRMPAPSRRPKQTMKLDRSLHTCHSVSELVSIAAAQPLTDQAPVYAVLGLAASSFVATFFVAPFFKTSFKEDMPWKNIYEVLVKTGVNSVTPAEASSRAARGDLLVDVRLPNKYEECRASRSVNVPVYIPIQKWDVPSVIRRAAFAFFGIYGTELNKNFAEDIKKLAPKGNIYLICERGGTLTNKPGTNTGFDSRSLKAYYYLQQAGVKKVYHVEGGLVGWKAAGLPLSMGQEDDDQDDGDNNGGIASKLKIPQLAGRR